MKIIKVQLRVRRIHHISLNQFNFSNLYNKKHYSLELKMRNKRFDEIKEHRIILINNGT